MDKTLLKRHFSATHIAYMALFTALAFAVTFLEFPIFPATPWFKLDFANFFFLTEGLLFGPVEAIVSIAVKELFCFLKSASGGVGELANLIMSTAYIIIPSIVYRFKKGRGWAVFFLTCACVAQISVSLPVNRYINYPFFMKDGAAEVFASTWQFCLAFNAIKSVLISLIVLIAYKPLSRLIRLTRERLERRGERKSAVGKAEREAREGKRAERAKRKAEKREAHEKKRAEKRAEKERARGENSGN